MRALRRLDWRPANAMGHADSVPEGQGPIRFLDSPPGPRVLDPEPLTGGPARVRGVGPGSAPGHPGRSASGSGSGSGSGRASRSSAPTGLPSGEAALPNPIRDGDGARWTEPAITGEDAGKTPWADPP